MKELSLDQVAMGRVFSAFLLGYALCQVPAPLPFLFGARLLLGIGEAPTFPSAAQAISRHVLPAARGRANGLVIAAIGLGSAIAPPLVSSLMVRWGWRTALALSALPALAVALAWLAVRRMPPEVALGSGEAREESRDESPEPLAEPRSGRLGSRSFVLLTASYTLQGYVGYIFVFWFYLYLVEVRHFDLLKGALLRSLPWLLSIVSIPLGGAASDLLVKRVGETWGRRIVPMTGLVGGSVFIAVGARTTDAVVGGLLWLGITPGEEPAWPP